jgi:4-hydroxy-3-polyprenylbenzoate decarboxylase
LRNFADETIRTNALAVRPTPQTIGSVKMNFPEIVDIALPAEGVFHNLVFVSIKKTYPMQAYKIMHGLRVMGQMMFTKYLVVVDADVDVQNTSEVFFQLSPLLR